MKVAQTAVAMILGIVLPLIVQLWDKRRLDDEARARSWNLATWASALYAFGPLSMLGWSWVTRRGWPRVLVGPFWLGAIVGVMTIVDDALTVAGGRPSESTTIELLVAPVIAMAAGVIFMALLVGLAAIVRGTRRAIARAMVPAPPTC